MKSQQIDYTKFEIPLAEPATDDESPTSKRAMFEDIEGRIPKKAVFIGCVNDEVSNFTSWEIDDHFYLVPLKGPDFNWALARISWDDNWGRYDWEAISRFKGPVDGAEAAEILVDDWIRSHGLDEPESPPYRQMLDEFLGK